MWMDWTIKYLQFKGFKNKKIQDLKNEQFQEILSVLSSRYGTKISTSSNFIFKNNHKISQFTSYIFFTSFIKKIMVYTFHFLKYNYLKNKQNWIFLHFLHDFSFTKVHNLINGIASFSKSLSLWCELWKFVYWKKY